MAELNLFEINNIYTYIFSIGALMNLRLTFTFIVTFSKVIYFEHMFSVWGSIDNVRMTFTFIVTFSKVI